MSSYVQKRIDYINNWPNVSPFDAEINYHHRCEQFVENNARLPFSLLKLWLDTDDNFNRAISHFIDSLDVMPYHPNFAFSFIFSALDYYSKSTYSNTNITICFKTLADEISDLANNNNDTKYLLHELFSYIPVSLTMYLYKCLSGAKPYNRTYSRVTMNIDNTDNIHRKNIVDSIYAKYGFDPSRPNNTIRQPALLYRTLFKKDTIIINGVNINITDNLRLHLLLSGIIYSLRNDSLHGSSMSSTKSSKTTPERYALNYYCYLATYTIFMLLLIMKSSMSISNKNTKYAELRTITINNIEDFRKLFGNHIQ